MQIGSDPPVTSGKESPGRSKELGLKIQSPRDSKPIGVEGKLPETENGKQVANVLDARKSMSISRQMTLARECVAGKESSYP